MGLQIENQLFREKHRHVVQEEEEQQQQQQQIHQKQLLREKQQIQYELMDRTTILKILELHGTRCVNVRKRLGDWIINLHQERIHSKTNTNSTQLEKQMIEPQPKKWKLSSSIRISTTAWRTKFHIRGTYTKSRRDVSQTPFFVDKFVDVDDVDDVKDGIDVKDVTNVVDKSGIVENDKKQKVDINNINNPTNNTTTTNNNNNNNNNKEGNKKNNISKPLPKLPTKKK